MLEKENTPVEKSTRKIRRGNVSTNRIKRFKETPLYRTSGNVTMSTNGAIYRFPNPFGAKQVTFFGIASRLATAGFNLSTNSVAVLPTAGAVYELRTDTSKKIVITGASGPTTIFALPDGTEPTIAIGRYDKVSGTGNSFIQVNSVSAPTVDIRADLFGIAHLVPAYYFKPQTGTSVAVAREVGNYDANGKKIIVQCGKWFLVVDENASASTPEYRARSIETTIVNIDYPDNSTIVARAEVVDYGADYFEVEVQLASNWFISGNFVCT